MSTNTASNFIHSLKWEFSNHTQCDTGFTYIISTIHLHHCGEWSDLLIGFGHQHLIWPPGTIHVVFSFKRHVCFMQTRPLKCDGHACIRIMVPGCWRHLNMNTTSVRRNIGSIFLNNFSLPMKMCAKFWLENLNGIVYLKDRTKR